MNTAGLPLEAALEAITRQMESLPNVPLILTKRAINDLWTSGYIRSEDFSEAAKVIRENLGGMPSNEVYIHRDRRNPEDLRILGDSLRLICALDAAAPVVKGDSRASPA